MHTQRSTIEPGKMMSAEDRFPEELLLNEPNRGRRLVQEFYQQYGNTRQNPAYYTTIGTQHEEIKRAFYRRWLEINGHDRQNLGLEDRKSTRLNSSHVKISYAVFCLKKKKKK